MSTRAKLSCRKKATAEKNEETARCITPVHGLQPEEPERDYSPVFLPCTQESLENVDVLWDWNSPQSKSNYKKKKKRVQHVPSPKLPVKKVMMNNNVKSFEKLKEELLAFQEEINTLKREEVTIKTPKMSDTDMFDNNRNSLDDFFNDSLEQELIVVSQQVEKMVEKKDTPSPKIVPFKPSSPLIKQSPLNSRTRASPRNLLTKSFSSNVLLNSPQKPNFNTRMEEMKETCFEMNDSFDVSFSSINLPEKDESLLNNGNLKMKTKSLSFGDHYANTRVNIQKDADAKIKEQIEKKRLEALAKLRSKKNETETSPMQCSPEEIANKRRLALAKLEAKKKQEIIERNRREAKKRLEMNRLKRSQKDP